MSEQNPASEADLTELPYADAVRELEAILERIEVADVDVDALSVDVARAAALLEHCRGRIARAETSIRDVLQELEASAAGGERDEE